jgi:potassium-dependent mechanosensitive channel
MMGYLLGIARRRIMVKTGRNAYLLLPLLASALAGPAVSEAAFPQFPKAPVVTDEKSSKSALQPQTQDIPSQRAEITRELAEAEASLESQSAPPAGINSAEINERRRLMEILISRKQALLSAVSELGEAQAARKEFEQKAVSWRGFSEKPPYSILRLDELSDATANARLRITSLESSRLIFQQEAQRFHESVKRIEEQQRLADEAAGRQVSVTGRAIAAWRNDSFTLQKQVATTAAAWALKRAEVMDERVLSAKAELALLERQIQVIRPQVRFSRGDLEAVNERIKSDRSRLDQEMEATLLRDAEGSRRLIQAEKDLAALSPGFSGAGGAKTESGGRELLEARVRLARAWVETSRFETEMLAALLSINQGLPGLWEKRFDSFNSSETAKIAEAQSHFRERRRLLKPWLEYAQQQLELARSSETEQRERLSDIAATGPLSAVEHEILGAFEQRKGISERLYFTFGKADRRLQLWLEDIETQQKSRSVSQRVRDLFSYLAVFARKVWQFELFAVEDTLEIGGQKVTSSRGVTVGKSIGSLILFLLSYLVASYFTRRMQKVLVSRFGMGEQQSKVLRRWIMAVAAFILLLLTLNLARIPLSVFAFLGGALAIGVGFGTQTLIKNFICGILILIERKVQVGDIVDVDGVVGRVTSVDTRASTVLGFDGVETVIPNSTFLEQKVTNWTHSDKRQRQKLRIGVAYGSDVELVRKLLAESVSGHGLVLAEPPPMVLFEDFGDNALMFAINYWIDLGSGVNSHLIASDLRFIIERRFADSGVAVPFPQRDVHLLSEHPLRVEVLSRKD